MAKGERKKAGWGTRILVLLAVALGLLLALEGALRARQWLKYGTFSATFYELETHAASGLEIPKPGSSVGTVQVNSLGFRGAEIEDPKPAGRLRIAFLGGSTTYCAETSGLEGTWPHLVTEGLREAFPGADLDYVNGAAGGYSTKQSLLNLQHRVAPLDPDVIVIYHGTNELTQDSREKAAQLGLFDPQVLEQDALGEISLAWYLIRKNVLAQKRKSASVGGERLEVDPSTYSAPFGTRLRALIAEARKHAARVVVVTFSHRVRATQSADGRREASASSLYYMPYMTVDGVLAGFEEYNDLIREVAAETDVLLVEGEDEIPGNAEHFADSVHLTDAGCALQAQRVLEAMLADERLRELLGGGGGA